MKHKSINLRRPLAVLMTVLMVMSAWVFVAPVKADAVLLVCDSSICVEVYDSGGTVAVYTYNSNNNLTKVQFPTWTNANGQDDLIWYTGWRGDWNLGGHYYNYAVTFPLSDHNNEGGTYITHVYGEGNGTSWSSFAGTSYTINQTPSIDRATYVRDAKRGYYVYAQVTSHYPVQTMQFPTWSSYNGQDDLIWYDGVRGSYSVNGQSYNYRYYVPYSDHH
ncbi:MAG: GBS Bsp-like repeat-containing protein [Clostridia bacterium]|nr:GBS Bsp-like repeat-containing protein [Clostridia bacterium]